MRDACDAQNCRKAIKSSEAAGSMSCDFSRQIIIKGSPLPAAGKAVIGLT